MRIFRFIRIVAVMLAHGIDQLILEHQPSGSLRTLARLCGWLMFWRDLDTPAGQRLRLALEALGPIFVKFGQVLSTRRDLLPSEIADELAKLQDQVPPFASEKALATLTRAYGRPLEQVFAEFSPTPVASASVAQVHFARLFDGRDVAVKILRPGISAIINQDIDLLRAFAVLLEKLWADGKRLKPREVVNEFAKHLEFELDLLREAANCAQLRRNFRASRLLAVPEVHWDWCSREVMVMERMRGIPISQVERLVAAGVDVQALARAGVEIFFTQVFRDAFFHADMHPGNILVEAEDVSRGRCNLLSSAPVRQNSLAAPNDLGNAIHPSAKSTGAWSHTPRLAPQFHRYIALDFGIMGTLNEVDQRYLAINFLAFFQRDYKRVAVAHVECGWAPPNTRVDELEAAIRAVCEPIFDRPLKEISFGKVLLRLFQTSRAFNIEVQPQLVLLQKTLLNIEGLGRQLDPELDLWQTAKPFLERWMKEQLGWRGLWRQIKNEAPQWAQLLPQLPRLMNAALTRADSSRLVEEVSALRCAQDRRNRWLAVIAVSAGVAAAVLALAAAALLLA